MRKTEARRSWFGRHKALVCLLALTGILVSLVGGWAVYLNDQIASVPRIGLHLNDADRPDRPADTDGDAVNILLAGTDRGNSDAPSVGEMVEAGTWDPGTYRTDTIIVLHISADGEHASLISIPRDSWVDVPGYGMNKINAAFSFGGPSLYVRTIEDFTGLRMDHLAILDWEGFRDLTTALGGVEIFVPKTVVDPGPGIVWEEGAHVLKGETALRYVRQRRGLPEGDFDRIKRQQNLIRAMMKGLKSGGTLKNPLTFSDALDAITKNMVVDDDFSTAEMRSLARHMQELKGQDITFVTIPVKGLDTIDGQSVVLVDDRDVRGLFGAVLADELEQYVEIHEADILRGKHSVS